MGFYPFECSRIPVTRRGQLAERFVARHVYEIGSCHLVVRRLFSFWVRTGLSARARRTSRAARSPAATVIAATVWCGRWVDSTHGKVVHVLGS